MSDFVAGWHEKAGAKVEYLAQAFRPQWWLGRCLRQDEDLAAAEAAMAEYAREGGRDALEVFERLVAEHVARYESGGS